MKILKLFLVAFTITLGINAQNSSEAKKLLDDVSSKMGAYKNMKIDFSSTLIHKEAGITNDPPIRGSITLAGEKYSLDYLGNNFLFDGKKLVIINQEEKEATITDGDLEEEDGFIYQSKLLTFYKEGYTYKMGDLKNSMAERYNLLTLHLLIVILISN